MVKPFIKIGEEKIFVEPPKMGTWRKVQKLMEENSLDKPVPEYIDNAMKIIVLAFNNKKVTEEILEDVLGIDEVLPLLKQIAEYFNALTFDRLVNTSEKKSKKRKTKRFK